MKYLRFKASRFTRKINDEEHSCQQITLRTEEREAFKRTSCKTKGTLENISCDYTANDKHSIATLAAELTVSPSCPHTLLPSPSCPEAHSPKQRTKGPVTLVAGSTWPGEIRYLYHIPNIVFVFFQVPNLVFLAVSPEEKESWVNALNVAIIKAKNRVLDEVCVSC